MKFFLVSLVITVSLAGAGFEYTAAHADKMGERLAQSVVLNMESNGDLKAFSFGDLLYSNFHAIDTVNSCGRETPDSHKSWKSYVAKYPSVVFWGLKVHGKKAKKSFEKELVKLMDETKKEGFQARYHPPQPDEISVENQIYRVSKSYYDSLMALNLKDSLEWIENTTSFSLESFYKKQKNLNERYKKLIGNMLSLSDKEMENISREILWEQEDTNDRLAKDVHKQLLEWGVIAEMPVNAYNYGQFPGQHWYLGEYPLDLVLFIAREAEEHPDWTERQILTEAGKVLNDIDALIE